MVYDALSYTWGDASKTKPILVNGCRFDTTESLHAALLQLRDLEPDSKFTKNELICIDALCINQKDDAEKSLQVQMMRDIYSEAAQVIVRVGTPRVKSREGFDAIMSIVWACNDYKSPKEDYGPGSATSHERLLVAPA